MAKPLLEGLFFLPILIYIFTRPAIKEYFQKIPKPHKVIIVTVFTLTAFGQYLQQERKTFPFVMWNLSIIHSSPPVVSFYQHSGITEEGKRIMISPPRVFPTLRHSRLATGVHYRLRDYENLKRIGQEDGGESEQAEKRTAPASFLKRAAFFVRSLFPDDPQWTLEERRQGLDGMLKAIGQVYNRKHPRQPIAVYEVRRGSFHLDDPADVTFEPAWRVDVQREGIKR